MAFLSSKLAFVTMATMALLVVMTNGFVVKIEDQLKEVFRVEQEFDFFTLALSWPATYCALSKKCCEQNACCAKGSDAPTGFVIRGLWPDYNNGSYPTCCQDTPYNEKEISTLLDDLHKHMPNFGCSLREACDKKRPHLAYVWEKHGTCTFPVLRNQYHYFAATLDLFYRHNITAILKAAGYGASSSASHSLEGIASTIKNAYGATPWLTCSPSGAIGDVRLCFDKKFQPRNCAEATTSSCPEKVSLPAFTPTSGAKSLRVAESWIEELEAF